jgi:hypothetical protein
MFVLTKHASTSGAKPSCFFAFLISLRVAGLARRDEREPPEWLFARRGPGGA